MLPIATTTPTTITAAPGIAAALVAALAALAPTPNSNGAPIVVVGILCPLSQTIRKRPVAVGLFKLR
jgi:hypothetical protein